MSPNFNSLKISQIIKETDDTISVCFEVPNDLQKDYQYIAGQYLTLRCNIEKEEVRRSYSLCSAPYENKLVVAIKQVENGLFSTFANQNFKVGDRVDVMTPMGNFACQTNPTQQKNYVLFAAGSGITPVISIAKSILQEEPLSDVTLFYGNKNFQSIIFREEIEALKNKHMNNFRIVHVLSRESLGNPLQKGRIDKEKCEKLGKAFLQKEKTTLENTHVFVCGPEEMILAVKDVMSDFGVPQKQIHFELFGTGIKKKNSDSKEEKSIQANVKIIIDGDSLDLELNSNSETILDAAQKAGADLPFACKGGVCCTCKAKILEGSAKMDVNYALEQDELDAGYILTCQAHPTSEKLVVSFDD